MDAPTERGTKEKSGDAVLRFDRGFEKSAKARTAAEQAMLDELGAHCACQVPTTRTCLLNHPMPQSGPQNYKHAVHTARTRAGPHAEVAAMVIQRLWRSVLIRRVFRYVRPPGIMIESAPCTPSSSCAGIWPWQRAQTSGVAPTHTHPRLRRSA